MAKKTSFNDRLMLLLGVPVVLAWVAFACYVIYMGINDPTVISNLDGYTTLIAIIGGPALLILTSMLELWKKEQQQDITAMPDEYAAARSRAEAEASHARLLETEQAAHSRGLEAERQKVELGLIGPDDAEAEE